jgi:MFS family permease
MANRAPSTAPHSAGVRLPATFRALRHRNYRLFFFGQMVSLIGTWMQMIAQQWLVYRLTGSATMLGVVSLIGLLPSIPMSLWGGSLADRYPKRNILIVVQATMMIQAFILSALTGTGAVQVWHVLVLAAVLASANAIDMPVRQSFVVEMVEGREDLTNAIGLNSTIFNAARAIGPALAGVMVAATGEAGAFFLNGVSFIAVLAGLFLMRIPAQPQKRTRASFGPHILEAARYVADRRPVLVLISLVAASAFLSMPYSTLLPVFAKTILKSSAEPMLAAVCTGSRALLDCRSPDALTYGLLMAAVGAGAVVGALTVASLPAQARRGPLLTAGNLLFPALLVGMALSRSFALTSALLLGVGFSFVFQQTLGNTLMQITTPDEMRGRVMSFYTMTTQIAMRLGGMQAGSMADLFGAATAVGVGAALCLSYGVFVAWRYPQVRNLA